MKINSRIITGLVIMALSIWFIVSIGFMGESGIDYIAISFGLFFLGIGMYIMFNKKEDDIENIKKD